MNWFASACIVLSLAAVQQSHPKEQTETAQSEKKQAAPTAPEKAAGDTTNTTQPGHPHQDNPPAKSPPTGEDIPWFQWKPDVSTGDLIAASAFVVAFMTFVVTAVFLNYTIKTWKQMVRANDDADKRYEESKGDIEESLKVTREGQVDTRRAIGIAEDQLRAVVRAARAWITIDSVETVTWYGNGVPDKVNVTFRNAGHSPAINVTLSGDRFVNRSDIIPGSPGPEEPQNVLKSNVTIGAGKPLSLFVHQPLIASEDDVREVADGRRTMFVAGGVRYDDIFSTEDRHVFQYAAKYDMGNACWILYISRNV